MTQKKASRTSSKRKTKEEPVAEIVVIDKTTDDCTEECDHDNDICVAEDTKPEPVAVVEVTNSPIVDPPMPTPDPDPVEILYGAAKLRAKRGR